MNVKAIPMAAIRACPKMRLDPAHYDYMGVCGCGDLAQRVEAKVAHAAANVDSEVLCERLQQYADLGEEGYRALHRLRRAYV